LDHHPGDAQQRLAVAKLQISQRQDQREVPVGKQLAQAEPGQHARRRPDLPPVNLGPDFGSNSSGERPHAS
jgi:hypothetical protein